jgi:type III pantothenate kinase
VESLFPIGAISAAQEVVAISSSPRLGLTSAELEERLGRPVRLLGDDVRTAVRTTYARPVELGLDRIAAVWGARELVGAGPLVVADVGTAVTVDGLDLEGRLVAVAIAPGMAAAGEGLSRAAPHLPPPPGSGAETSVPARGTADSLRNGFLLGFAGLVDRLIDAADGAVGAARAVVLTGGGAGAIHRHLRVPCVHEPDAVLHGIRALHLAVRA